MRMQVGFRLAWIKRVRTSFLQSGFVGLLSIVFALVGCYPKSGSMTYAMEAVKADQPIRWDLPAPYLRIGGLPFNYDLQSMKAVSVERLGSHAYRDNLFQLDRGDELSEGVLYTKRGGFIDLAHVRNAADLTRFAYLHLQAGLLRPQEPMVLKSSEPSIYLLDWTDAVQQTVSQSGFTPQQRQTLAVVGAQRLAYVISTWHEIITYAGFKGTGVVSELQSSFTCDDQPSNMLGVYIGGEAIQACLKAADPALTGFDAEATKSLARWLQALEPTPKEATTRAAESMVGRWHTGRGPMRRLVHAGVDDQPMQPWLVEQEDLQPDKAPVVWRLPEYNAALADGGRALRIVIKPYILESRALAVMVNRPERGLTIHAYEDFPVICDQIVAQEAQAPHEHVRRHQTRR